MPTTLLRTTLIPNIAGGTCPAYGDPVLRQVYVSRKVRYRLAGLAPRQSSARVGLNKREYHRA